MKKIISNHKKITLDKIDSTNNYARELIEQKVTAEGLVIIAKTQTAGKGSGNNKWESESNKNLTFSIILHPMFINIASQFIITQVISLAITDYLMEAIKNKTITIKWPNDIYINNSKICGILIENIVKGNIYETAIVGIGLNVNQTLFSKELPNPTSLRIESDKYFDLDKTLNNLLLKINKRYNQLLSKDFALIEDEYLKNLYRFNQIHKFKYKGITINAKIIGINRFGMLKLKNSKDNKIIECNFNDIDFII